MNDKTESVGFRLLMLVIALIGIGISIYAVWRDFQKKNNGYTPAPPVQCESNADCPTGQQCDLEAGECVAISQGTAQVWPFVKELSPPSKTISYEFPQPVYVSSITGMIHLVNTCPGCWFVTKVGWSYYVVDDNNRTWLLGSMRQDYGFGEGAYPINLFPSMKLKRFIAKIDWYYPFGDDVERFQLMTGDALVLVGR